MAKQKKPVHRVQMTEGKRNIIHQLLEEYDIQTAEDIQDAFEYYSAAEPPVRCGESHLSGLTEPPIDSYSA